jgi:hypothetical protein
LVVVCLCEVILVELRIWDCEQALARARSLGRIVGVRDGVCLQYLASSLFLWFGRLFSVSLLGYIVQGDDDLPRWFGLRR